MTALLYWVGMLLFGLLHMNGQKEIACAVGGLTWLAGMTAESAIQGREGSFR